MVLLPGGEEKMRSGGEGQGGGRRGGGGRRRNDNLTDKMIGGIGGNRKISRGGSDRIRISKPNEVCIFRLY